MPKDRMTAINFWIPAEAYRQTVSLPIERARYEVREKDFIQGMDVFVTRRDT